MVRSLRLTQPDSNVGSAALEYEELLSPQRGSGRRGLQGSLRRFGALSVESGVIARLDNEY